MRELTSHKVNGLNEALKIQVLDEPGAGGANHRYVISTPAKPLKQELDKPKSGLSPLAAIALGLLTAAVPAAGVIGYLLNKPAITNTVEKIIEKPGATITTPGQDYDVEVDMEVIPPRG